jgi:hypothetical protein
LQLLWQLGDFFFHDMVTFHQEGSKKWKFPSLAVSMEATEEHLHIFAREFMAE